MELARTKYLTSNAGVHQASQVRFMLHTELPSSLPPYPSADTVVPAEMSTGLEGWVSWTGKSPK